MVVNHFKKQVFNLVLQLLAAIVFITLYFGAAHGTHLPTLTLRGELPPIRTTYPEITQFVTDIVKMAERSRRDHVDEKDHQNMIFTYQIKAKGSSLADDSLDALLKDPRLPNPAYEFRMSRYVFYEDSISELDITMGETSSEYKLSGTDMLVLESLRDRIESFAQEHKTWAGGFPIVVIFFMLFLVSGSVLLNVGTASSPKTLTAGIYIFLGVFLMAFAPYLFISGRLTIWFPRTAIYTGSSSFMERYSPEFTFWGFVISLLALIITVIIPLMRPAREQGK